MSNCPKSKPKKQQAGGLKRLKKKHLSELRESGLTDKTIIDSLIYSAKSAEIKQILGWGQRHTDWGEGMVIPYLSPDETKSSYKRVKLDFPRHSEDDPIKYESPLRQPNRLYVPPNTHERLLAAGAIVITEGEKKALAVSQFGFACVGLVGVWGWQQKRKRDDNGKAFGNRRLIPDLEELDLSGKTVYLAYDSDAVTKPQVQLAEAMFAKALTDAGAVVRAMRIPAVNDDKTGIDDYLVFKGADASEALDLLIAESIEPEMPNKMAPMDWARLFVDEYFRDPTGIKLRWYGDEFYRWDGKRYLVVSERELRAIVLEWLDERQKQARPKHATDVVKALEAVCRVPFNLEMPLFLDGNDGIKPSNIIAFDNELLDLTNIGGDLTQYDHTPEWFSTTALPFPFQPETKCPAWEAFLREVLVDPDAILLLQMWFGLMLTGDTSFHKILLMIGPGRAGKGTTVRVMQHVIGQDNCATASFSSLGGDFGLWPWIRKSVVVFPDAHLGQRVDGTHIAELLKSISGEDRQTVNRKCLPQLANVRLSARIVITMNQFPRLTDASNALASRFLILPFNESFEGREDRCLEDRLLAEAPGILNWSLQGLHALRHAGKFPVTQHAEELLDTFKRLSSPVGTFIDECCEEGDDLSIVCVNLYRHWEEWCDENGHKAGSTAIFGSKLKAARPRIQRRRQAGGSRPWVYQGLDVGR
jgi:putative DNA primase/helicase